MRTRSIWNCNGDLSGKYVTPSLLAVAASAAGERDEAIRYAQEAVAIGDPIFIAAKYYPTFARLREDPRFQEILMAKGWK